MASQILTAGAPAFELPVTATREPDDLALGQWMRAYQGGDTAAFERLYARLAPRLSRYFNAHTRDEAIADDLVQETFLALHRARHTYDPDLPLEPWLFAIARYVFLMHCRARGRRQRRELAQNAAAPAAIGTSHEAEVLDRRTLAQLLPRAPASGRGALVLHHLFGLDFQEIGERLGLSVGAARVRASRALSELRQQVRGGRRDV